MCKKQDNFFSWSFYLNKRAFYKDKKEEKYYCYANNKVNVFVRLKSNKECTRNKFLIFLKLYILLISY